MLDGVYVAETPTTTGEHAKSADLSGDTGDTSLLFHPLSAPTPKDIEDVAEG